MSEWIGPCKPYPGFLVCSPSYCCKYQIHPIFSLYNRFSTLVLSWGLFAIKKGWAGLVPLLQQSADCELRLTRCWRALLTDGFAGYCFSDATRAPFLEKRNPPLTLLEMSQWIFLQAEPLSSAILAAERELSRWALLTWFGMD